MPQSTCPPLDTILVTLYQSMAFSVAAIKMRFFFCKAYTQMHPILQYTSQVQSIWNIFSLSYLFSIHHYHSVRKSLWYDRIRNKRKKMYIYRSQSTSFATDKQGQTKCSDKSSDERQAYEPKGNRFERPKITTKQKKKNKRLGEKKNRIYTNVGFPSV